MEGLSLCYSINIFISMAWNIIVESHVKSLESYKSLSIIQDFFHFFLLYNYYLVLGFNSLL